MPEDMPEDMPEHMPDRMPDRMPEDMSDGMPEDLPDRMPEDMPDRMPEDMPEDMPDRMPDRMPEDMSDRMPEDLPVRKCINAMVGIIRSEVIFWLRLRDYLKRWGGAPHTFSAFGFKSLFRKCGEAVSNIDFAKPRIFDAHRINLGILRNSMTLLRPPSLPNYGRPPTPMG